MAAGTEEEKGAQETWDWMHPPLIFSSHRGLLTREQKILKELNFIKKEASTETLKSTKSKQHLEMPNISGEHDTLFW